MAAEEGIRALSMDPLPNENFLVSFVVRVDRLPRLGREILLLGKTERVRKKTRGWSISIGHLDTGFRPSVFWRSAEGGEEFTFERFDFRPGTYYAFTLVAHPQRYLALYVQKIFVG